jgi:protein TonB
MNAERAAMRKVMPVTDVGWRGDEPDGPIARISVRRERLSFGGLASLALHGFALGGLLMLMARHPPSAPPEAKSIEMVFQPADEPDPPPEPEIEAGTRPEPPPATEAMAVASPEPRPQETAAEIPTPGSQPEQVRSPPAPAPEEPPSPPLAPTLSLSKPMPASPPAPLTTPRLAVARESSPAPRPRPPPVHPGAAVAPPSSAATAIGPSAAIAPTARPAARATVQPIAAAAPPPRPAMAAIDPSWQAALFGWLASRETYPEDARRRGEQGVVAIRFTVDRFGRVLEKAVVGGSGAPRLDEAALALLQQGTLPAFPAAMTQPKVTITTAIRYSLR